VVVWGSGTPMRDFMHGDDIAATSVHVMNLADQVPHRRSVCLGNR
jgi:GDP-L-fucose synthase